jgi:hypothetical protein
MGKGGGNHRYVNTFFWDDPYIEGLCLEGKLLFIYLITTPLTNIAGSFEITLKRMAEHTGITREKIGDLLGRFEADGKCIYRDNWMLTVNTARHQSSSKDVQTGIARVFAKSPQWVREMVGGPSERVSHSTEPNSIQPDKEANAAVAAIDTAPVTDTAQEAGVGASAFGGTSSDSLDRLIWELGVSLLVGRGCPSVDSARSLLGRWVRDYGGRQVVAAAVASASTVNTPDVKAYIGGILRAGKKGRADMSVGKYVPDRDAEVVTNTVCPYCHKDCCLKDHRADVSGVMR